MIGWLFILTQGFTEPLIKDSEEENYEEGYEGSQTQIGVKSDGTVVWGFFSHCSCYGYEDYEGENQELTEETHTQKTYEMQNVDLGVLEIIKTKLNEISKRGLKDG